MLKLLHHCWRNKDGQPTSSLTKVSKSRWSQNRSDQAEITDSNPCLGRSGVEPTEQSAWGDWCNVIGAGFGARPSTNTGNALEDAFVWVKPGGESDGTSNSSAPRYDYHCGYSDALQPAPEAGTWFQVSLFS